MVPKAEPAAAASYWAGNLIAAGLSHNAESYPKSSNAPLRPGAAVLGCRLQERLFAGRSFLRVPHLRKTQLIFDRR